MVHGFHSRQPIENEDEYLFCWFMHNRNRLYAANGLRQLKLIFKKGDRLLVSDYYPTEAGKNQVGVEKQAMRTMGINMLANLNAQ